MYGRKREPTAEATLSLSLSPFSCLHSTIRLPCVSGSLSSLLPFPPLSFCLFLYISHRPKAASTLWASPATSPKSRGKGFIPEDGMDPPARGGIQASLAGIGTIQQAADGKAQYTSQSATGRLRLSVGQCLRQGGLINLNLSCLGPVAKQTGTVRRTRHRRILKHSIPDNPVGLWYRRPRTMSKYRLWEKGAEI